MSRQSSWFSSEDAQKPRFDLSRQIPKFQVQRLHQNSLAVGLELTSYFHSVNLGTIHRLITGEKTRKLG